jgi:hypothetical protein
MIFQRWKADGGFLWLSGIPGAGKTIISSTIIANLLKEFEGSDAAVVYSYLDFSSETQRHSQSVLRAFLSQASGRSVDALAMVQELQMKCAQSGSADPMTDELLTATLSTFETFPKVYAVVDGLDECDDRDAIIRILGELQSLPNVHLLALSRDEVDIDRGLRAWATKIRLEGPKVDSDIATYIRQRMSDSAFMDEWDEENRMKVEKTLMDMAGGMYTSPIVLCDPDQIEFADFSQVPLGSVPA